MFSRISSEKYRLSGSSLVESAVKPDVLDNINNAYNNKYKKIVDTHTGGKTKVWKGTFVGILLGLITVSIGVAITGGAALIPALFGGAVLGGCIYKGHNSKSESLKTTEHNANSLAAKEALETAKDIKAQKKDVPDPYFALLSGESKKADSIVAGNNARMHNTGAVGGAIGAVAFDDALGGMLIGSVWGDYTESKVFQNAEQLGKQEEISCLRELTRNKTVANSNTAGQTVTPNFAANLVASREAANTNRALA